MWPHWISVIIPITVTLIASILLIKKNVFPRPISIFMGLFIIGQVIGYGMDVDFLKVNIPHGDTGTSISLASIFIPLSFAFIIDYASRLFIETQN
ncbi:MAG: hypothetical protein MJB12_10700 [Firmicutes bacterium]|nr:hypothetical protein [Bacillota bacterium]